jgi:hypothetical protein
MQSFNRGGQSAAPQHEGEISLEDYDSAAQRVHSASEAADVRNVAHAVQKSHDGAPDAVVQLKCGAAAKVARLNDIVENQRRWRSTSLGYQNFFEFGELVVKFSRKAPPCAHAFCSAAFMVLFLVVLSLEMDVGASFEVNNVQPPSFVSLSRCVHFFLFICYFRLLPNLVSFTSDAKNQLKNFARGRFRRAVTRQFLGLLRRAQRQRVPDRVVRGVLPAF